MNDWTCDELSELLELLKDGSHGTHEDVLEGIPLLSAKDISDGGVSIPKDTRRISLYDYKQIHKNYELRENDLLVTLVGSIGRVALMPLLSEDVTFQRSVGILRFTNTIDPRFAFYFLQSSAFQNALNIYTNASAQGGVYLGSLARIEIKYPPLPVQHKIAHILSTVDRQIEKTEQLIRKYEMVKEGMMQDLFTRGIDVKTGKLRPTYDEAPGLYKESELGRIPKEWEVTTIGSICQKFINGGTPPTSIREFWEGTIPWVTGADFLESFEIGDIRRKITSSAVKNSATHIIPKGNILLVTRTGVGKIAIAPFNIAISQDITGLELDSNQVSTLFFYYYLQVLAIEFKKLNQGTSINGITRGDIEKWKIILPSKSEQILTEAILNTFNRKIKTEIESHHILGMQKIALMQDLLTGRVVPPTY